MMSSCEILYLHKSTLLLKEMGTLHYLLQVNSLSYAKRWTFCHIQLSMACINRIVLQTSSASTSLIFLIYHTQHLFEYCEFVLGSGWKYIFLDTFSARPNSFAKDMKNLTSPEEQATSTLCSVHPAFSIKDHCLLCGKGAKYDGRKWGFDVIPLRSPCWKCIQNHLCPTRAQNKFTKVLHVGYKENKGRTWGWSLQNNYNCACHTWMWHNVHSVWQRKGCIHEKGNEESPLFSTFQKEGAFVEIQTFRG